VICGKGGTPVQGKTVVITGATSGIGNVTANHLAQQGARIIFIARDTARAEQTLKQLETFGPNQGHAVHYADLSRLSEMIRVATSIKDQLKSIDVLINNAGGIFAARQLTQDGLEETFATNHMAYFVITNLLLGCLRSARAARIVCTASGAYRRAQLDFDDLQSKKSATSFARYERSKLMNILFTRELARRLQGTHVTANCLHPGFVATRFGESSSGVTSLLLKYAKKLALSPEQGARTLTYLASSADVAQLTGSYFYKCKPARLMKQARNDEDARRLWDVSVSLSGVGA
jgi:NAD(P)-dependent dehydrogenase (short-subunit alcohol dehydrogenase family)